MSCHKQCYDKKTAITILNERKNKDKKWSREKRIYECPECGKWHLTSQEEYFLIEEIPINELIFCKRWQELSNKNL